MANIKISALTAASTPLAGTEVLPIVQSGATVKVSVDNLTTGKSVSGLNFVPSGSSVPTNGLFLPAANSLGWATNSIERIRIDASGNFGLGVTPSAWTRPAIQVGGVGTVSNFIGTNTASFGANYYFDGSNRYISNGFAGFYAIGLSNGEHQWYSAASGTAGAAITFTRPLTIDASGNLLVGTTTSSGKLTVADNAAAGAGATNTFVSLQTLEDSGTNAALTLRSLFTNNNQTNKLIASINLGVVTNGTASPSADIRFNTISAGTFAERARITSAGNVVAGGSVALATTATDGFLYVPTCAGTPTGTPTAITGMAPIVVDTTNNKLYFYSGGTWRDAGP